jgi:hypothetical protein
LGTSITAAKAPPKALAAWLRAAWLLAAVAAGSSSSRQLAGLPDLKVKQCGITLHEPQHFSAFLAIGLGLVALIEAEAVLNLLVSPTLGVFAHHGEKINVRKGQAAPTDRPSGPRLSGPC